MIHKGAINSIRSVNGSILTGSADGKMLLLDIHKNFKAIH